MSPSDSADPGDGHVVLVGLPGSGKSTVGPLLAAALGRDFLDFDLELARRTGMSVSEIFARHGEAYFRDLETRLTVELQGRPAMVMAPGGGWVARPINRASLGAGVRLIYLRTSPAVALRRMGKAAGTRPLLERPDPLAELERLLRERRTAYERASQVIDVDLLTPQQVTDQVLAGIRNE